MNRDKEMINACTSVKSDKLFPTQCPDYPLDNKIIEKLKNLGDKLRDDDDDYQLF